MGNRKSARAILIFLMSGILFFLLTYLSNTVLAVYAVSSVRPSAAMNPVLGIGYGWPAILGCAVANFVSDLVSGYGIRVALMGFLPQILYGALPWYIWRRLIGSRSHITRLDSPRVTLCFAALMVLNSAVIGLFVGAIQYSVTAGDFWDSAFFAFRNDFAMCLIFGLPVMVVMDWAYSRFRHHGKRRISVNEKVILLSSAMQLLACVVIAATVLIRRGGSQGGAAWKDIMKYWGFAVGSLLAFSVVVMYYLRYLKRKNEGLRIFERRRGTVYADEKRRLEFVSYPDRPPEYRCRRKAMGFTDEEKRPDVRPAYEKVWHVSLSCQKGCPMKCDFCDCSACGFHGNATEEDLAWQIDTIVSHTGSIRTGRFEADFTRMGEPCLNPAVIRFIESGLREHVAVRVDAEMVYPTLSTMMPREGKTGECLREYCRVKNEVYDGNADLHITICSTDETVRRKVFRNLSMTLEEISGIAATLPPPGGSKYALSFPVSRASVIDAEVISRLFDREKFRIRLTPVYRTFNAVDGGYADPAEDSCPEVFERLEKSFTEQGWDVETCLYSGEEDDDALTCGSLLLPHIREKISPVPSRKKKIGMIVAVEMDAIFSHYPEWKELEAPPGFRSFLVEQDTYDLHILHAGMGEIAASSGVQYLIAKYGVNCIVNFGVVGGLTSDMSTHKVCLVNRVVHYKYDCSEFMDLAVGQVDGHDSIFLTASESLVKSAMSVLEDLPLATCCSGDKFVATMEEKRYLHDTFEGDICDMESAGIVLACEANGVPCLLLKAVADGLADGAQGYYAELQSASLKCLVAADTIMERMAAVES